MTRWPIAFVLVLLPILPSLSRADSTTCTQFGNPPAVVQQGWFATKVAEHNPLCFGGETLGPWKDSSGVDRYACQYAPAVVSKDHPLPLVIFLHGSMATADSVGVTGLKSLATSVDLGGSSRGFIVLAPEGRETTHYYPGVDAEALGWDNWYRQLDPGGDVTVGGRVWTENPDAATIDHFLSVELASGEVDPKRIYLMGWSNGAAMAILYSLERPQVAAAAVYSAPNPFGAFIDACPQSPVRNPPKANSEIQVRNPGVHIMHVRNACDIAGICPNGDLLTRQLKAAGVDIDDVIVDGSQTQVDTCDPVCGTNLNADGDTGLTGATSGFFHHVRWPSRWTANMLGFLKNHPQSK